MKPCKCCGQLLPDEQFYRHRNVCKPCIVVNQRKARRRNEPAYINELFKQWGRV